MYYKHCKSTIKPKLIVCSIFLRVWFMIIIAYFYVFCSRFPFRHPLTAQELLLHAIIVLLCFISIFCRIIIIALLLPLLPRSFTAYAFYVSLAIATLMWRHFIKLCKIRNYSYLMRLSLKLKMFWFRSQLMLFSLWLIACWICPNQVSLRFFINLYWQYLDKSSQNVLKIGTKWQKVQKHEQEW